MMPQPICSPASIEPPVSLVLPPPVMVPVKVPEMRYSRDEMAVVSGATGSWVSLLPTTDRCQPSGVSRMPGAAEGTAPVSGGGPDRAPTGWTDGSGGGGSASATGAVPTGMAMQTAASVAKRFNMSWFGASRGRNLERIQRICRDGASNGRVSGR